MTKSIKIGIDQSFTKTGLVFNFNDCDRIDSMIITGKKSDEPYDIFKRAKLMADNILTNILNTCNEFPLHEVKINIEGLSFGSAGAAAAANRDLAGLQFIIMTLLLEHFGEHSISIVAPTSLKKFASGKGNCDKDAMVEAIKQKSEAFYEKLLTIPKTKGRFDLADAFWLANYS
ncbi:ribonuclease H-like domain protein [Alishewanella phage vB_AspM_Slicko01]|nr:ribonuclease H-like domain protein [Alishewanella phage vB_AspM_Slicko01]